MLSLEALARKSRRCGPAPAQGATLPRLPQGLVLSGFLSHSLPLNLLVSLLSVLLSWNRGIRHLLTILVSCYHCNKFDDFSVANLLLCNSGGQKSEMGLNGLSQGGPMALFLQPHLTKSFSCCLLSGFPPALLTLPRTFVITWGPPA